jgi:alpha/beta superfamily hydrolase
MGKSYHQSLFLQGPAGRLEALLWTVPEPAPLAAVVCHPHPLYGGTLHNKVVFHVARALHELGLPVLRFNFRGVGLSEGTHDGGRGEQDDVRAALDWLAAQQPGRPLVLAGFSFGAAVGLRVGCNDPRVVDLIGLGLPVAHAAVDFLHTCQRPLLLVHGEQDQFGPVERVRALAAELGPRARLVVVEGVDHFFTGRLEEVERAVESWMRERHPELAAVPAS